MARGGHTVAMSQGSPSVDGAARRRIDALVGRLDRIQQRESEAAQEQLEAFRGGYQELSPEDRPALFVAILDRLEVSRDEIGSALIASRLVRDIMRLAFLMERVYPPYPKWFGTAFRELECAAELEPVLTAVLNAPTWQKRESSLCQAYRIVAAMHNELQITEPLPETPSEFLGRPFRVIDGGAFAKALVAGIEDASVKSIAARRLIGSVDLFSDSANLLEDPAWRLTLKRLYQADELDI